MKKIFIILVSCVCMLGYLSGCSDAKADNVVVTSSETSTAPFRITRTSFPRTPATTINKLDLQCVSEFGGQYTTATAEEARGLANTVANSGVFAILLDGSAGVNEVFCFANSGVSYCSVLCIKK